MVLTLPKLKVATQQHGNGSLVAVPAFSDSLEEQQMVDGRCTIWRCSEALTLEMFSDLMNAAKHLRCGNIKRAARSK